MNWTDILLHHSQTKDGRTMSWDDIRRYHVEDQGWKDIGYHYGIELIEDSVQVLVGRMLNEAGAHCYQQGMNSKAIGICIVGNFDLAPPGPELIKPAVRLIKSLMDVFLIPASRVRGHRDFANNKTCPGEKFDMEDFRAQLR